MPLQEKISPITKLKVSLDSPTNNASTVDIEFVEGVSNASVSLSTLEEGWYTVLYTPDLENTRMETDADRNILIHGTTIDDGKTLTITKVLGWRTASQERKEMVPGDAAIISRGLEKQGVVLSPCFEDDLRQGIVESKRGEVFVREYDEQSRKR